MKTERVDQVAALAKLGSHRGAPAQDVAPITIVDDLRDGPYFPFTRWYAGSAIAGVAAQYPIVWIHHVGPKGSAVVIDRIRWKAASGSLFLSLMSSSWANAQGLAPDANSAWNMVKLDESHGSLDPQLANVAWGQKTAAARQGAQEFDPLGTGVASEAQGPFVIGPDQYLCFSNGTQANSLDWAVFGRYYDSL